VELTDLTLKPPPSVFLCLVFPYVLSSSETQMDGAGTLSERQKTGKKSWPTSLKVIKCWQILKKGETEHGLINTRITKVG